MKKIVLILFTCFCGFVYLSVDGSLELLQIKKEAAVNYIKTSMEFGTLSLPQTAKKVEASMRAQIAVDMITIAREYTESPAFKQWYAEIRKAHEPKMPQQQAAVATSPATAQLAQTRLLIEEQQRKMAAAPSNERDAIQKYIDQLQQTAVQQAGLEAQQRSAAQNSTADMAANQAYMNNVKLYNDSLANWKMVYPENATMLIKYRLQQYQELLSTVDFSAQTMTDAKGIVRFVNPEYEKRSGDWKRCFRTGKAANDAVQGPIREWLTSLR